MTTETLSLKLDQIRIDGGTQSRIAIDERVVAEYAEHYSTGVDLPPVTVFCDGATQRDAILYSLGANADHGLRRTNADKRKAVLTMLEDEQWSEATDHEIARLCRVTQPMVSKYRSLLKTVISDFSSPRPRTYKTKHGTLAHMKTGNINRHRHRGPDSPNPIRQARPALAQTNLNLPHDPAFGAPAIVSAMGEDYAHRLIDSLTAYLQTRNKGAA